MQQLRYVHTQDVSVQYLQLVYACSFFSFMSKSDSSAFNISRMGMGRREHDDEFKAIPLSSSRSLLKVRETHTTPLHFPCVLSSVQVLFYSFVVGQYKGRCRRSTPGIVPQTYNAYSLAIQKLIRKKNGKNSNRGDERDRWMDDVEMDRSRLYVRSR